ncbi:hypothetical protein K7G98_39115, partial [Saccharothrix sp. MB29]|nr:hypothetical protein [Saccharothrix sp. MB29]
GMSDQGVRLLINLDRSGLGSHETPPSTQGYSGTNIRQSGWTRTPEGTHSRFRHDSITQRFVTDVASFRA